MIKTLSVDIETFSSTDLAKCGVYKYAESEDFEVLLFAYSVNHGPVSVVDLASGEEIPGDILNALTDDLVQLFGVTIAPDHFIARTFFN